MRVSTALLAALVVLACALLPFGIAKPVRSQSGAVLAPLSPRVTAKPAVESAKGPLYDAKPLPTFDATPAAFDAFIKEYKRTYTAGSAEYKKRFELFQRNVNLINKFNKGSPGDVPVALGVSNATDRSLAEMSQRFLKSEASSAPAPSDLPVVKPIQVPPMRVATSKTLLTRVPIRVPVRTHRSLLEASASVHDPAPMECSTLAFPDDRDTIIKSVFEGAIFTPERSEVAGTGNQVGMRTFKAWVEGNYDSGLSWSSMLPAISNQGDKNSCWAHSEMALVAHAMLRAVDKDIHSPGYMDVEESAYRAIMNYAQKRLFSARLFRTDLEATHALQQSKIQFRPNALPFNIDTVSGCAALVHPSCQIHEVSPTTCAYAFTKELGIVLDSVTETFKPDTNLGIEDLCKSYVAEVQKHASDQKVVVARTVGCKKVVTPARSMVFGGTSEADMLATLKARKETRELMALTLYQSPFTTSLYSSAELAVMLEHYMGGVISEASARFMIDVLSNHPEDATTLPFMNQHQVVVMAAGFFNVAGKPGVTKQYFRIRDSSSLGNNGYILVDADTLPFGIGRGELTFPEVEISK